MQTSHSRLLFSPVGTHRRHDVAFAIHIHSMVSARGIDRLASIVLHVRADKGYGVPCGTRRYLWTQSPHLETDGQSRSPLPFAPDQQGDEPHGPTLGEVLKQVSSHDS